MHVHGERDGSPCSSFFMVRVASAMVRGRVATAVLHLVPRSSLGKQAKVFFFFFRALSVAPRRATKAFIHVSYGSSENTSSVLLTKSFFLYLHCFGPGHLYLSSKLSTPFFFHLLRLVCGLYCALSMYFLKIFQFY